MAPYAFELTGLAPDIIQTCKRNSGVELLLAIQNLYQLKNHINFRTSNRPQRNFLITNVELK